MTRTFADADIGRASLPSPPETYSAQYMRMLNENILRLIFTRLSKNEANFSVILTGIISPTTGIGNIGNYYLDTVGHVLYGPKAGTGTIWPIALS
jgi:hypothetical protein